MFEPIETPYFGELLIAWIEGILKGYSDLPPELMGYDRKCRIKTYEEILRKIKVFRGIEME